MGSHCGNWQSFQSLTILFRGTKPWLPSPNIPFSVSFSSLCRHPSHLIQMLWEAIYIFNCSQYHVMWAFMVNKATVFILISSGTNWKFYRRQRLWQLRPSSFTVCSLARQPNLELRGRLDAKVAKWLLLHPVAARPL